MFCTPLYHLFVTSEFARTFGLSGKLSNLSLSSPMEKGERNPFDGFIEALSKLNFRQMFSSVHGLIDRAARDFQTSSNVSKNRALLVVLRSVYSKQLFDAVAYTSLQLLHQKQPGPRCFSLHELQCEKEQVVLSLLHSIGKEADDQPPLVDWYVAYHCYDDFCQLQHQCKVGGAARILSSFAFFAQSRRYKQFNVFSQLHFFRKRDSGAAIAAKLLLLGRSVHLLINKDHPPLELLLHIQKELADKVNTLCLSNIIGPNLLAAAIVSSDASLSAMRQALPLFSSLVCCNDALGQLLVDTRFEKENLWCETFSPVMAEVATRVQNICRLKNYSGSIGQIVGAYQVFLHCCWLQVFLRVIAKSKGETIVDARRKICDQVNIFRNLWSSTLSASG